MYSSMHHTYNNFDSIFLCMYVIVYVLFFYLYKYIYSVCVCVNSWCYRDTTLGITKKPVAEPSFASGEGCGLYDMLLLDFLNSLRLHL